MVPTQSPTRMYRLWYLLSHLHECTDDGTHSVTQMYRLWYPLNHLHECTEYGTHSVTYTNVPTMVPTQSPTRMYRLWYPLSHLHECTDYGTHSVTYTNVPTMVPTQSPTRRTSYAAHLVSPRVYLLGVPSCLLYKIPAVRTSHFPIQYTGSDACSFSCTIYRHWGTRILLYNVPVWAHVASHIL